MADKITEKHRIMLKLIERSADIGDGWRQVSDVMWRHVEDQAHPDLTELDRKHKRVRITPEGLIIMKYAL